MTTTLLHDRVRVGRYELLRPLAVGGMAELHVARAVDADGIARLVVLKQILPQHASNPRFVDMFVDEARVASQLRHPNIVEVLDSGRFDGRRFIAMEYLHGRDLRAIMRAARPAGGLSIDEAVAVAIDVCAGLHYAHEWSGTDGRPRNIVHRDISPQNVVVTFTGDVKIIDFGIAKACDRLSETQHGELKGKLRYMSPEQCRGEETDRRSDIFSTATLLWELTVGRKLFDGKSELEVMTALSQGVVTAPSQLVAGYPAELERIILRGLAATPRRRWGTAREMGEQLRAFAASRRPAPTGAHELGALLRALFADELDTVPLVVHAGADPHAAPTRVSSIGDASRPRLPRARVWAVAALAVVATLGLARWAQRPLVARPATMASPPPPRSPSPPSLSSPPSSPSLPAMSPPPSPPPSVDRGRHGDHSHHHHAHRAGSRNALSGDLDALME